MPHTPSSWEKKKKKTDEEEPKFRKRWIQFNELKNGKKKKTLVTNVDKT